MTQTKLTPKQAMFCKEYLVDLNATQAAIRAGYSKKTANVIATQNLSKLYIQEHIKELMDKRSDKVELTSELILKEIMKLAFFDSKKLYNDDGSLKEIHELDDDTAKAIACVDVQQRAGSMGIGGDGIKHIPERVKKIKTWDKLKALELLGRHLVLFTDKQQYEVSNNLAELIREAKRPRSDSTADE